MRRCVAGGVHLVDFASATAAAAAAAAAVVFVSAASLCVD